MHQHAEAVPHFGPVSERDPATLQPGHHQHTLIIVKDRKVFTELQAERVQSGEDRFGLFDPRGLEPIQQIVCGADFGGGCARKNDEGKGEGKNGLAGHAHFSRKVQATDH